RRRTRGSAARDDEPRPGCGEAPRRRSSRAEGSLVRTVAVRHLGRVVLELRVLAEERELHFPDGAVALLRNDDVGNALARRVLIVHFLATDHHDYVGILLDRARLTQVV